MVIDVVGLVGMDMIFDDGCFDIVWLGFMEMVLVVVWLVWFFVVDFDIGVLVGIIIVLVVFVIIGLVGISVVVNI